MPQGLGADAQEGCCSRGCRRPAEKSQKEASPEENLEGLDAEHTIKRIVYTIMKWAAICPQEMEYMRKYEDTVCYDRFSEKFSQTLYVGIIEALNLWPRIKDAVRPDLPKELINRLISFNCSVYARYIAHLKLSVSDPEFEWLAQASADSIWNSIRAL